MKTDAGAGAPPDQAVALLASESKVSVDDVARLYGRELIKLESDAHIRSFLPIFAIRNVRRMLRRRRAQALALAAG
jgi:hypothetical protein